MQKKMDREDFARLVGATQEPNLQSLLLQVRGRDEEHILLECIYTCLFIKCY